MENCANYGKHSSLTHEPCNIAEVLVAITVYNLFTKFVRVVVWHIINNDNSVCSYNQYKIFLFSCIWTQAHSKDTLFGTADRLNIIYNLPYYNYVFQDMIFYKKCVFLEKLRFLFFLQKHNNSRKLYASWSTILIFSKCSYCSFVSFTCLNVHILQMPLYV